MLKTLNIYIYGDDYYCPFPLLDYFENSKYNHVSLFFVKKKYPNPPISENVRVFDFPDVITPEWLSSLCQFAKKINSETVRIHSAIHHCEKIVFPLLKAFQQITGIRLAMSLFLYETRFSDVILRQEYNKLLSDGFNPLPYVKKLKQELISGNTEWNAIYNYLFSSLANTQYYLSDMYKAHHKKFISTTHFHYLNYFSCVNNKVVGSLLNAMCIDDNIISMIRDVNINKKTLFYVDDGLEHPLGLMNKDECLLHEIKENGFECVFLINYKGMLNTISGNGVDVIFLPENINLAILLLAGINPRHIYGFFSLDLFYANKESIKKILFHEHEFYKDNLTLKKYLSEALCNDIPLLYINEAQRRLADSSVPKQIFLLAESMGDVLFAAGGLNALRDKLYGYYVCIVPKVYHSLLSLCPWVDELWDPERLNNEQVEDIYTARVMGNFHLPSHVQHILDKKHQIDSFLEFLGHENTANRRKEIVLSLDKINTIQVDKFLKQNNLNRKIVLIHPNVGVPNRTWPQQSWAELIEKFIYDGWSVVLIGSNNNFYSHKKAVEIQNSRVFNAIDRFTMAETIYLMTKASLLVACDSGPVALAATTNIAICALYSVVPGKYRLPYRHGSAGWNALAIDRTCHYYHCANMYSLDSSETFDAWCPNNKLYTCMNEYTPADFYREITRFVSSKRFVDQAADVKAASE